MNVPGSNIIHIVDYTAARAALIQNLVLPNGTTVGVRSTYGSGAGYWDDPLRPGFKIQPVPERPTEPMMHVSRLPEAPTVEYITQSGTVELTWTIPMSLYLQRGDAATAQQVALPFYSGYLGAFVPDWTLGGLALLSTIKSFKSDTDEAWYWLDIELEVLEVVSF